MGARRLLVFGGIGANCGGMLFGDNLRRICPDQNGGQTGQALLAATQAVAAQDHRGESGVYARRDLLEDRGTKVDTHVHMIEPAISPAAGFNPALCGPFRVQQKTAGETIPDRWFFAAVGIFLIHYVGLDLQSIYGNWMGEYYGRLRGGLLNCADRRGLGWSIAQHACGPRNRSCERPQLGT